MAVGKQWELPSPTPVSLQLSQQSRCPDFFLFLCRLLSPLLKAFAQAATFLHQGRLPDTGEACASPAIHRGRLRVLGMGSACGGPGSGLLWPAELGYVEQLFQFLQATAQEDGFFGESQAASVGRLLGGWRVCWWLLPPAGQCQTNSRKEGCREGLQVVPAVLGGVVPSFNKKEREACASCFPALPIAFVSLPSRVCRPKSSLQRYLDLQRPRGEGQALFLFCHLPPTPLPTPHPCLGKLNCARRTRSPSLWLRCCSRRPAQQATCSTCPLHLPSGKIRRSWNSSSSSSSVARTWGGAHAETSQPSPGAIRPGGGSKPLAGL